MFQMTFIKCIGNCFLRSLKKRPSSQTVSKAFSKSINRAPTQSPAFLAQQMFEAGCALHVGSKNRVPWLLECTSMQISFADYLSHGQTQVQNVIEPPGSENTLLLTSYVRSMGEKDGAYVKFFDINVKLGLRQTNRLIPRRLCWLSQKSIVSLNKRIMEKHRARSFYGLGIFVFFLYFMEVSSVSKTSVTSIIDVMTHDKELCKLSPFLYNNTVTKVCHNKTFPEKDATYDNDIKDKFPCLAFYDTMYKVCKDKKVDQLLKNLTTFYSNIQNNSTKTNPLEFCDKIKNITFSYEKLKPFLTNIHLNSPVVCHGLCFDLEGKFIPLCATLNWRHALLNTKDHNDPQSTTLEANIPPRQDVKHVLSEASNEVAVGSTDNVNKKDKADALKGNNETQKNKHANVPTVGNMSISLAAPPIKDKPSVANSDVNVKQNAIDNANSSPANKHKEAETSPAKVNDPDHLEKPSVDDDKPEESKKLKESENTNTIVASNIAGENKNDANDETNPSTISENTQNHDNIANQDEPEIGIDETNNEANQGQSIPEQSSPENIGSPYSSSMRADEESHFFTYFTVVSLISIAAYIGYHNKQKILAIVLEGRRSRNSRGRRRPSTANYRKLDCTLEEAVTSQCNANVTHVIY